MNTIVVGPIEGKTCTFVGMCKGLANLGLKLLPINTNTISSEDKINLVLEQNIVPSQTLVLFLTEDVLYPSSAIVTREKQGLSWTFHNEIITTESIIKFSKQSFVNSYSSRKILHELEASGITENNVLLPEGYDNDVYKPIPLDPYYSTDISLIGNKAVEFYKNNEEILSLYKHKLYENLQDDTILPNICSSSKIIIYDDSSIHVKEYFPVIITKILGCGAYLVCNDPKEYLGDYLMHGKDCVFLSGDTSLEKALSVKDYERKQLIPFSRDRAATLLNWTKIVERIIKTITKND